MWYLFFQMWVWILLAFVLGWFANWFFCCRNHEQDQNQSVGDASESVNLNTVDKAKVQLDDSWKPLGFATPPTDADDLKRIKGIGAVNEKALNELGIYQFTQIADWSSDNVNWVEGFLAFPGRIGREQWVQQAKTLSQGGTTEFANKVDSGEVGY